MPAIRHESMRIAGEHVGSNRYLEVFNPYTLAATGFVRDDRIDHFQRTE